jgi:hypothetical protein
VSRMGPGCFRGSAVMALCVFILSVRSNDAEHKLPVATNDSFDHVESATPG